MRLGSYVNLAIIRFKEQLMYRLDFLTGVVNPFITIAVLWFVWSAVYASSPAPTIGGFTFAAMITYTSIAIVMRSYTYPGTEYRVEEEVKSGSVGAILIKPLSYPFYHFSTDAGSLSFWLITKAPIVLFAFIFLGITGPASLLFFVSAFLGYVVNYLMVFMTAMWAFWTTGNVWGLRLSRIIVSEVASGALVPLSLFPLWMQNILNLLPFQAVFYMPLTIYMGMVSGYAALATILIQLAWIGILFSLVYFGWRMSIKKVIIQGG